MELQILFEGDDREVALSETLEVVSLGNECFRLEQSPAFCENVHYGDVVELARQDEHSWRFVRVVQPSGWRHLERILPKILVESEMFELWLESIAERGGFWEVAYGGIVFISYPPNSQIDAEAELSELTAKAA